MPRLLRRTPPVIVFAVAVAHRRRDELFRRHVIERCQLNRDEVAADFRDVAARERTHAAMFAEQVMHAAAAELIVTDIMQAGSEPKGLGLDHDAPLAGLAAHRAIAFAGAFFEIDIGLVTDGAAMAAAVIGLQHRSGSELALAREFIGPEGTTTLLP